MLINDLFSYRADIANGYVPDVYQYDYLPKHLRVQIAHIWDDAIGHYVHRRYSYTIQNNEAWNWIHKSVAREHGAINLASGGSFKEMCVNYLLDESLPVNKTLDLIELSFKYIENSRKMTSAERDKKGMKISVTDAVKELNERFRRAGVGYKFSNGQIMCIDSEFVYSNVVKRTLSLLSEKGFKGPNREISQAYFHYRNGNYEEAILFANNAFESTMKVICEQRGWKFEKSARGSDLLKILLSNKLLPDYLDNSFQQLVSTLQSGLPKVRNEESAHGKGSSPQTAPFYIAAYALNLAAVNILFLVTAHKVNEDVL